MIEVMFAIRKDKFQVGYLAMVEDVNLLMQQFEKIWFPETTDR